MQNEVNDRETLLAELEETKRQLYEAQEAIEAIRTGQVDALIMQGNDGHQLYTLQTADHAYRLFIEKMNEGAVTLNPEGLILYANSRFAQMLGYELSHVIGAFLQQFVDAAHQPLLRQLLSACQQNDCKGELWLNADNKKIPVSLSLTLLEQAGGNNINGILTDLTSMKANQEQLEEANRRLEQTNKTLEARNSDLQQFASVASHDLQEPLRKIQMFSNIIKENAPVDPGKNTAYIEKIIKSADRMRTLIVDVLNYSRLSASHTSLSETDVNEVVSGLLEDFELLIREKNARIEVGPLPVIQANRGQIYQALQNLLSNALKFSARDQQPVISITAERIQEKEFNSPPHQSGPWCRITFKDNGVGFDQKYAAQIFSLFERLYSKDQYEGTGIGLAITKKIIDDHQGLITATSIPNAGATFHIILPLQQSQH